MLEKMGISDGGGYMRTAFPDGVPLESAFIAPQLRAQLDATLDEAASSGSWMDAQSVLPSAISPADASSLLQRAAAAHSKGRSSKRDSKSPQSMESVPNCANESPYYPSFSL